MNVNADETKSFEAMFKVFAQEHNINVGRYCATKLLSFYNHNFDPVMLYQLDADAVAPIVLKPFKHFNVKRLVRALMDSLAFVADDHMDGYLASDFFDNFIIHNIQNIGMKEGYSSVYDIAYYQVELINNKYSKRFFVNFHTESVEATFKKNREMKGSLEYIDINVYYRDFESLREPMMAHYANDIGEFLDIPVDTVDEDVLKLLDMVKI